jgi:hypothetical protein
MTAHHVEHEIATRITGWGKPAAPAMKREAEKDWPWGDDGPRERLTPDYKRLRGR